MDATTPFAIWIPGDAGFQQVEQMFQQQAAIDALLAGKESAATVLDMLAEQGVDPHAYLDEVELAVEAVIGGQVWVEDAEMLLILRE